MKYLIFLVFILLFSISAIAESNNLTYDLGASVGSVGNSNYTEINLGLNYTFKPMWVWRNALFSRFASDSENISGVDSSVRRYWFTKLSKKSNLTTFAGPGIRIPSKGDAAPLGEAGLILKLGSLSIGGGIRMFFNKLTDGDAENDTQYFLILAGSGSL